MSIDKKTSSFVKQMDKALRPESLYQEHMKKYLEPQHRFQDLISPLGSTALEQINKTLGHQHSYQEQMEKYLEPQRRFRDLTSPLGNTVLEQINKVLGHQRSYQEQMEKYLEPRRRFQDLISPLGNTVLEQINKVLGHHQRSYQGQMEKYLEPQRRFRDLISPLGNTSLEQINKTLELQRSYQEQIEKYLLPLNRYLSDPLFDSVYLNNDGAFSVGDETVSVENVSECINNISVDHEGLIDFTDNFIKQIEKLNGATRTIVKFLLLSYFLPIFVNLTTPWWENSLEQYSNSELRTVKKEITRKAVENYGNEDLQSYRFVSAKILYVRNSSSNNADIVDELYIGKVIRLIKKEKSWSLIEYQDYDTGDVMQGWVFSRYLSKFNK